MRSIFAGLLALVLFPMLFPAEAALADSTAVGSATNWFKSHDRNKDGYLTADEVIGYELKLMKRADTDGDGKLSLSEFIAGVPPDQPEEVDRYRRRFTAMDADHDGFATPDEATTFYRFLLKTSDTNADGYVSLEEWLGATAGE
jgi:Ca2+-binding EF-hand superfamily protein